ncbi:MAG: hypothetical protein ACREOU_13915 [Candidatus Eiseniibacteriota bacterium]
MLTSVMCHHCGEPVGDSPHEVMLHGMFEDYRLPICVACQSLRQNGQLPVELLLQQWVYSRGGAGSENDELTGLLVRLVCLGCGMAIARTAHVEGAPGGEAGGPELSALRLPDGSLSTMCGSCQRTNLLERRGSQLVAVRLW